MTNPSVDLFLQNFTAWAESEENIQAAALVGSQARGSAKPSSDVDLVILARSPGKYLRKSGWAARFGEVDEFRVEDYGRVQSLRVWYRDGLEVEYGFTDESWADLPMDEGTRRVVSDGMCVLCERAPLLSRLLS